MWAKNLFIVALGVGLIAGCGPVADPSSMIGQKAPDFEVETLQSKVAKTTLSSFKGKPVIIDFWATWCGPCRQLSPRVESIYADFKSKGLVAMAISDEKRETVQDFESKTPHHMPVFIDPNDIASFAFRVPDKGLPTVIVLDKSGTVIYDQTGFVGGQLDVADQSMRDAVERAIGNS